MSVEESNKALAMKVFEEAFNRGELSVVDEVLAGDAVDRQEEAGTNFCVHLKAVIVALRTAFPDLRFEVHDIVAERDMVSCRSTMTGTHEGRLNMGPFKDIAPTGRRIEVAHMHFIRMRDGKGTNLWHLWDTPGLMRQLGTAR